MHLVCRYQLDYLSQLGNFKGQSTEGLCHASLAYLPPQPLATYSNKILKLQLTSADLQVPFRYMDIHHSY